VTPAKRFLWIFLGVYALAVVVGFVLLGSPNLSRAFLETGTNKTRYDRYIEIVKSDDYKLYRELAGSAPSPQEQDRCIEAAVTMVHRPDEEKAHELAAALADNIRFVREFEADPLYRKEARRRDLRALYFDVLNFAAVVAIAWRFGRKPLLAFLDQRIDDVRMRIQRAEEARAAAAQRQAEAARKLDALEADKARIAEQTQQLLEREVAEIREMEREGLAQIEEEIEERKRLELRRAAMELKRELVVKAIGLVADRYRDSATAEERAVLVDEFIRGLETSP